MDEIKNKQEVWVCQSKLTLLGMSTTKQIDLIEV